MDGEIDFKCFFLSSSLHIISLVLMYCYGYIQGTLLNSKSLVSATNAEALREASSMGVKVVLATGKVRKFWILL